MGAWYFKQPNGKYGRFSTVVDTVTDWDMTKDELHQNMIDRLGKYDYDVQNFEDFVNQSGMYDGKHNPYYLHEFKETLNHITSGNETTESLQVLLFEMGVPKEEAEKYYFMDYPEDDDDPAWDNYDCTIQKRD